MKSWRSQRGDVPVGCLISGAVLLIVVLVAIKVAPVVLNVGEFDNKISVLADRANRREYNDKRILKEILEGILKEILKGFLKGILKGRENP